MLTKAKLKKLEMASVEEYFEYVLNVKENGHDEQARELFNALSPDDSGGEGQQTEFFNWLVDELDKSIIEVNNIKNYFNY